MAAPQLSQLARLGRLAKTPLALDVLVQLGDGTPPDVLLAGADATAIGNALAALVEYGAIWPIDSCAVTEGQWLTDAGRFLLACLVDLDHALAHGLSQAGIHNRQPGGVSVAEGPLSQ